MENLENNPFENTQQEQSSAESQQAATDFSQTDDGGRKESPFASSPYDIPWSRDSGRTSEPPKKKSGKGWKTAVSLVLSVGILGGSIAGTAAIVNNSWEKKATQMEASFTAQMKQLQEQINGINTSGGNSVSGNPVSTSGMTPSQVYEQNVKSVVAISNQGTTNYFGQVTETASSGTGFILSEDGYVVTNYHVVEGADTLSVLTYDGTEYSAKLVGYEENNDLAVLKIEATGLPAVVIGSSDDLIVGDMVVAIGNPLGELTSTQTVGYISAKNRDVSTDGSTTINMMQTDAAINPGNSGGPLFNMNGEVVGITTAKYSGTTNSGATIEGIGFAIPIDDVIGMIDDLVDYGYVTGAYLGVTVINMDEDTAALYGLPVGVSVRSVDTGSCAEKAGMQVGDIIVGLGDMTVENYSELSRALRKFKAGDTTTITVLRNGQEKVLSITLDEKPQPETDTTTVPDATGDSQMPENGSYEEWFNYFAPFFGKGNN